MCPVTVEEIIYEVTVQQGPSNEVVVTTPGPQGAAGAAATIAVGSVTNVGPAGPPTVVNAGTSSAAVLNFGLQQGATGAQGIPGDGFLQTGPFTVAGADNEDLLGEVTDNTVYNMVDYTAKIRRSTTAFVKIEFTIFHRNGGWELALGEERYNENSVEAEVDFTVDPTTGQINADNTGSGNVEIFLQKNRWTVS